MPGSTLPPDQGTFIAGGTARTERLERHIAPDFPRAVGFPPLVFTYPGTLSPNVESPPWYPAGNVWLVQCRVSLLANATSNHVVEVHVDGASVQSFTLLSGTKTIVTPTSILIPDTSYVTVKTITVADADMSVEIIVTPG